MLWFKIIINNVNWVIFKILIGILLKKKHILLGKYGDLTIKTYFLMLKNYYYLLYYISAFI
jgi:hypothetical protein